MLDTGKVNENYGQIQYHVARNQRLITSWLMQSGLNCEAYNALSTVGSDHRIVTAKLR